MPLEILFLYKAFMAILTLVQLLFGMSSNVVRKVGNAFLAM